MVIYNLVFMKEIHGPFHQKAATQPSVERDVIWHLYIDKFFHHHSTSGRASTAATANQDDSEGEAFHWITAGFDDIRDLPVSL